jgi:hypothetical protein
MTDPPRRHKSDEEMTVGDWAAFQRTGERPERDEYRQARREALEAAGLEPDDDAKGPTALEDMTPEDHFARDDGKRVEAALTELKRREEQAWQSAWDAAISAERLCGYRWMIDYLDLVSEYQRKKAAADEAADRLRNIGEVASIRNFQTGLWGMFSETLYDEELLGATSPRPLSRQQERERLGESPLGGLTVDGCERLRKRAETLAAAEIERASR